MTATAVMVTITAEEERAAIVAALTRLGAVREEAETQAHVWVEADLRGRHSHGIQRLPNLAQRLQRGLLVCGVEPIAHWRSRAFVTWDGRGGFGPSTAFRAITALTDVVRDAGVVVAAIRNTSHLGMLAPYVEALAAQRLIGLAFTTSEALVHPAGGTTALIGTNPIGVGFPVAGSDPFVLDMSTGAISAGEIIAHAQRGLPLPLGCAVDADGVPTTDAVRAQGGAISPFGGAKGYGLGLAVELIVAALTQTALGRDVKGTLDAEHPATKGDLLIAFDLAAPDLPAPDVAGYLAELRAMPAAPGSSGVRLPGDRARAERERRLTEGITLPAPLWEQVLELT